MDLEPIDVVFDSDEVGISDDVAGTRDTPAFTLNPPITDCVGVALLYANVPFTYYVIDETCNSFRLIYSATNYDCQITPGTYTSQNIEGEIIKAISQGATPLIGAQFKAFVDNTDNNLIIYNDANVVFQINFNVINSVYRTLGFEQTLYTSTSAQFFDNLEQSITKHFIRSPRVVNLTGPAQMFLNSDLGGNLFGKVRNQTAAQGLLGFWGVNSNYTGTIETFRENPMRIPIGRTNITGVKLKLLLGNRTAYDNGAGEGIVDHVQLNGEAFQVAIRFFRLAAGERITTDSAGNSTTSSTDSSRSSVPRTYLTTGRMATTQDIFDAQRFVRRRVN